MYLYDYDEDQMTEAQAQLWNEAVNADEVAKASWNELFNLPEDDPMLPMLRERYEEKLDESVEAIQKFEEAMKE